MPGLNTEQREWLTSFLSLGAGAAEAKESGAKASGAGTANGGDEDQKFSLESLMFWKKKPEKTAEVAGGTPEQPKDQKLSGRLNDLDKEIAALKKLGFDTKTMEGDWAAIADAITAAEKLADEAARKKALAAAEKRLDQALGHAKGLAKSVKDVMADAKGNPNDTQKTAIYKKALEDEYGISVDIPEGMSNTHLDRVFDMFGSVPKEHANQDKLKKLTYVKDGMAGGGSYNRSTYNIKMGDFGDASGEEEYETDGTKLQANSFDVTTLHEIGHAVDNKNGVMRDNGSKTGCGEWKSESVDTITTTYLADAKATLTLSDKVTDDILKTAISTALSAGTTAKPDAVADADWQEIVKYLVAKCLPIRAASKPWFAGSQVVVGGRVHQEAYGGVWWSYAHSARTATKVNSYQWRAPGEWFAEVYAISWLKKKKPPSGVDGAAAAYCWTG